MPVFKSILVSTSLRKSISRVILILILLVICVLAIRAGRSLFYKKLPLSPMIGGSNPVYIPQTINQPEPTLIPTLFLGSILSDPLLDQAATSLPPSNFLEFESLPFIHDAGLVELAQPENWLSEQNENSISFYSPDAKSHIDFQVTNTGNVLDANAFQNFVTAREENLFLNLSGSGAGFTNVEQQIDSQAGTALMIKSLAIDNIPQIVLTGYQQVAQSIYTLDYYAAPDSSQQARQGFEKIWDSIVFHASEVAGLEKYSWKSGFNQADNQYTIDIPVSWLRKSAGGTYTQTDFFYSPDDRAVIQIMAYSDDSPVSRALAGKFVLTLLRSYYSDDVVVTADQILPEGLEQLTWSSANGEYHGTTLFTSYDNTLLVLTGMVDDAYQEIYQDVLDQILTSVKVSGDS